MKLRIKGDSLRLRVSPSEVSRLLGAGRIEETIHFGAGPDAKLIYSLMTHSGQEGAITVRYHGSEIAVSVPSALARAWAEGEQVGMYNTVDAGFAQLELAVEKDFACLDKGEAENQDTYPNPSQGVVC